MIFSDKYSLNLYEEKKVLSFLNDRKFYMFTGYKIDSNWNPNSGQFNNPLWGGGASARRSPG